ncbi:MAG: CHAT domain-containing protein [Bacteroidales bacterium]|nr:CHAT domain-containing protein [Bacteroidales bacterium]MCF8456632.1 CHAT domain-containing protein [Bacteroidales bacterium]
MTKANSALDQSLKLIRENDNVDPKLNFYYNYIDGLYQYSVRNNKEAIVAINNAFDIEIPNKNYRDSISFFLYNIRGSSYLRLRDFHKATESYKSAVSIYQDIYNNPDEYAKVLANLANSLGQLGQNSEAIEYLLRSIKVRQGSGNQYPIGSEGSFLTLGNLYKNINELELALDNFSIAEKILSEQPNPGMLANIYASKATIFRMKGDFDKAKSYQENAIFEYHKLNRLSPNTLPKAYNSLGLILKAKGDYLEALDAFFKSIDYFGLKNTKEIATIYRNCSNCYVALGMMDNAEMYTKMELAILKEIYKEGSTEIISAYINLSALYLKWKDYEKGLEYLGIAENQILVNYGASHPLTGNCMEIYAIYYSEADNPLLSVKYFQKALALSLGLEIADDYLKCPSVKDDDVSVIIARLLKGKAAELQKLAIQQNSNIDLLAASLESYQTALQVIGKLRQSFLDEESRLFLSANEMSTFTKALELAIELSTRTEDDTYKRLAFELAERSKAANLLASIRTLKAGKFGGIPDSLSTKETTIKDEINSCRKKIFMEKQNERPNKALIDSLENQFFLLTNQHDQLIQFFEDEYPSYHNLKYESKVVAPEELRKFMQADANFVEYVTTENSIVAFLINPIVFEIFTVPIDQKFQKSIRAIINSLTRVDISSHNHDTLKSFVESTQFLYSVLIEPFRDKIHGKHLIISTDQLLAYIPFEILLSATPPDEQMNYRDLPYLLRDYAISYSYSATLLSEVRGHMRKKKENLVAYAPDYKLDDVNFSDSTSRLGDDALVLYPLPQAYKEAKQIADLTGGKLFKDAEATKTNFLTQKDDFDVIHFSMHAIIENSDPMFSKLVFSQGDDTLSDRFLYTYEIYNMRITARLSVLSACNTGDGVMRKGEGIMSFARSFIYAGCPSIIMTLWPVEDKAGSGIMIDFYKFLNEGMPIDESLRLAKLNHISNADPIWVHPFFWAEYVIIGENSPVYSKRNPYLYFAIALLLVLVLSFILIRKYRKPKLQ